MKPTSTKSDLNLPLKLAIIKSLKRQSDIARSARIGEVRFSKIVTGRIQPTPKEQERIAKTLQSVMADAPDQSELFPDAVSA